jgi:hypothetical protein
MNTGPASERINFVPLNRQEVRYVLIILRTQIAVSVARKVFYGRNLSLGMTLVMPNKRFEPTGTLQTVLSRRYRDVLRNAFDWEVGIGIVPYRMVKDEQTGIAIPAVVEWGTGEIYAGYDSTKNKTLFRFLPSYGDVRARVNAEYDKSVMFYEIPQRTPCADGKLRTEIATMIPDYKDLRRFMTHALSVEKSKANMPRVIKSKLPDSNTIVKSVKDARDLMKAINNEREAIQMFRSMGAADNEAMDEDIEDSIAGWLNMQQKTFNQRQKGKEHATPDTGSSSTIDRVQDSTTGAIVEMTLPFFSELQQMRVDSYSSDLCQKIDMFDRKLSAALDVTGISLGSSAGFKNEMQTFTAQSSAINSMSDRIQMYEDMAREMYLNTTGLAHKKMAADYMARYRAKEMEHAATRGTDPEDESEVKKRFALAREKALEFVDIELKLIVRSHMYHPDLEYLDRRFKDGFVKSETYAQTLSEMLGVVVDEEQVSEAQKKFEASNIDFQFIENCRNILEEGIITQEQFVKLVNRVIPFKLEEAEVIKGLEKRKRELESMEEEDREATGQKKTGGAPAAKKQKTGTRDTTATHGQKIKT